MTLDTTQLNKGLVGHWKMDSPSEKVGSELTDNGDFEDGTWTDLHATIDIPTGWNNDDMDDGGDDISEQNTNTDYILTGTKSWHLILNVNGEGMISDSFPVVAGKTYRIESSVYSSGKYRINDVNGRLNFDDYHSANEAAGWTHYSVDSVATATGNEQIKFNIVTNATKEFYIDHISIKEIQTADSTPSANNGTVYGATQNSDDMTFDGSSDDYVSVSNNTNQVFETEDFAYSVWFKTESTYPTILMKKASSQTDSLGYAIILSAGQMYVKYSNGATSVYNVGTASFNNDEWHHIVISRSGSTISLYEDGAWKHNTTCAYDFTNTEALNIGYQNITGDIKDVRMYDRALSTDEVSQLYSLGGRQNEVSVSSSYKGLVGEWKLDSDSEKVGSELVTNGDMELDANWLDWGTIVTEERSSTQAHSGTYSRHIVTNAGTEGTYQNITTVVGKSYKFTGWIYGVTNNTRLFAYDATGSYRNSSAVGATSTWTFVEWTFIAEETTTSIGTNGQNASGEWYFDNASIKEIQTADSTPNANNGVVYGATVGTSSTAFNGTSDYINIDGALADMATSTSGTFSAWVKPTDATPAASSNIITFNKSDANEQMVFRNSTNGTLTAYAVDDATGQWSVSTDAAAFADGTWVQVVLVQDGTSPVLYINGVAVAQTVSVTIDETVWFSDLVLDNGRIADRSVNTSGESQWFGGDMKDIKIYDRALSADEIALDYKGAGADISVGSLYKGLVLDMPMNEEAEKVGSDLLSGWDFTSGYTTSGGNSITDADTFAGTGIGYLRNDGDLAGLVVGKTYRLYVSGTISTGTIKIYTGQAIQVIANDISDFSGSPYEFTVTGIGATGDLAFRTSTTQTVDITNFVIKELRTADTTPNANHGVLHGATQNTDNMTFNGTSDYVDIADADNLSFGDGTSDSPFSISAWVNMTDSESYPIFAKGLAAVREYYFGTSSSEALVLSLCDHAGATPTINSFSVTPLTAYEGSWVHVTATYDGFSNEDGILLYVNGEAVSIEHFSIGEYTAMHNEGSAVIGRGYTDGSGYADGETSNLKIYNRTLSPAEIELLYKQQ